MRSATESPPTPCAGQGYPHRVILGVEIPRIAALARKMRHRRQKLADELWGDTTMRETRILATYLFDPDKCDIGRAIRLAGSALTREEADMLAFRLFPPPQLRDGTRRQARGPTAGRHPSLAASALRAHLE